MLGCSLAGDTGCGLGVVVVVGDCGRRSSPTVLEGHLGNCAAAAGGKGGAGSGGSGWAAAAKWRLASRRRHSRLRPTTLYGQSHVSVSAEKEEDSSKLTSF